MKGILERLSANTSTYWTKQHFPDYLNDLNASHEMEKVLTREQHEKYWLHLCRDIVPLSGYAHCATASQRSDAFLLTLG